MKKKKKIRKEVPGDDDGLMVWLFTISKNICGRITIVEKLYVAE